MSKNVHFTSYTTTLLQQKMIVQQNLWQHKSFQLTRYNSYITLHYMGSNHISIFNFILLKKKIKTNIVKCALDLFTY